MTAIPENEFDGPFAPDGPPPAAPPFAVIVVPVHCKRLTPPLAVGSPPVPTVIVIALPLTVTFDAVRT